jgi:hypothetical protein
MITYLSETYFILLIVSLVQCVLKYFSKTKLTQCHFDSIDQKRIWELKNLKIIGTSQRFFGRNHGIDRKQIANRNWNMLWDMELLSSSPEAVVRGGGESELELVRWWEGCGWFHGERERGSEEIIWGMDRWSHSSVSEYLMREKLSIGNYHSNNR